MMVAIYEKRYGYYAHPCQDEYKMSPKGPIYNKNEVEKPKGPKHNPEDEPS